MSFILISILTSVGLCVGILVLLDLGRRLGRFHIARHPEAAGKNHGSLETAVFGLMGLLLAFTFSSAVSRYDARRELVNREALIVDTIYFQIELLPESYQLPLKNILCEFIDERIAAFKTKADTPKFFAHMEKANRLSHKLWKQTLIACKDPEVPPAITGLITNSINDLFGVVSTRLSARYYHPPVVVYYMLGILILGSALLAGYGMAEDTSRSWAHFIAFAVLFTITFFMILNMEYPRLGVFGVRSADQILIDYRSSMAN